MGVKQKALSAFDYNYTDLQTPNNIFIDRNWSSYIA